jgi:antitoxin (DNA-binding transcriptional repressor) of toxin-antitoxin stability system
MITTAVGGDTALVQPALGSSLSSTACADDDVSAFTPWAAADREPLEGSLPAANVPSRVPLRLYVSVRCSTILAVTTMSASEARAALPEILDRVLAGEEVTITRHGEAVAVVVRPDTIRVRRADQALADAERLRDLLDRGRASRLSDAPDLTVERAEQLVAEVAAARSAR